MRNKLFFILFFTLLSCFFTKANTPTAQIYVNGAIQVKGTTIYVCKSVSVNFTDSSLNNTTRSWKFQNGTPTTATTVSKSVSFSATGTDTVYLTVTDSSLNRDSTYILVKVQKPTASFSFSPTATSCAGTSITFTNSSTGNAPLTYSWAFGNVTLGAPKSTTDANPIISYNPNGGTGNTTFTVTVTATDSIGCVTTSSGQTVTVKRPPDSELDTTGSNYDPSQGIFINCTATYTSPNYTLYVANASTTTSSNTSYSIDWGDSSSNSFSSSFSSTSHTYTSLGYFTIALTTSCSTTGCSKTKNYTFYNGNSTTGNLSTVTNVNDCVPYTITWPVDTSGTNQNPPGTKYSFWVDDGTPKVTYTQATLPLTVSHYFTKSSCGSTSTNQYTVHFDVSNPCGTNPTSPGVIRASLKPTASFTMSPDTVSCVNSTVTFTNNSKGNYFVGGTCHTNFDKYWVITPSTGWTLMSGKLRPDSITATINGSNAIGISFTTPGTYSIQLLYQRPSGLYTRCDLDSVTRTICVQPVPSPKFSFTTSTTSLCSPTTLTLTNTSNTLTTCGNTTYKWSVTPASGVTFISGTDSSSIDPVINFNDKGSYKLRLTVTNKCGTYFKDSIINIKGIPVVTLLSNQNYCDSQSVNFGTNLNHKPSYDSSYGTISNFNWSISPSGYSFLNGTDSSSKYPVISFPNTTTTTTTYQIISNISNECGNSLADTQSIKIYSPIKLTVNSNQTICSNQQPTLLTSATPTGGNGTYSIQWQQSIDGITFSDTSGMSSSTFQPPVLTSTNWYRLKVSSSPCDFYSNSISIKVLPAISNNYSSANTSICFGSSSPTITGSIPTGGDSIYSYQWQLFNDTIWNNTSSIDTFQNFNPGNLSITTFFRRIVTSGACSGEQQSISKTDTITVNPLPLVNAGVDFSKCGNQTAFVLSSGTPIGGIWSGTGVINDSIFNPSIMSVGSYSLLYTYTNSDNCTSSDTLIFTVISAPTTSAGNDTTVCQNANPFQLSGFTPSGGTWSGRGVSSTGLFNPSSAGAGMDTLVYSFSGGSNCNGLDTLYIMVNPQANINFTLPSQICSGSSLNLNASINNIATVNSYQWSASNNSSYTNSILSRYDTTAISAVFPEDTSAIDINFNISLIAITNNGCTDSASKSILLMRKPQTSFLASGDNNCGPATFSLTNNTTNVSCNYLWSASPSTLVDIVYDTLVNPHIQFPVNYTDSAQNYSIKLIANRIGSSCVDSAINTISIFPKPKSDFYFSDTVICFPKSITTINTSSTSLNSLSYKWTVSGASTFAIANDTSYLGTTVTIPDNTSGAFRNYEIRLMVQNSFGCKDSISKTINVPTRPIADFVLSNDSVCSYQVVQTTNQSLYGNSFKWMQNASSLSINNSDSFNASISIPIHTSISDSSYLIKLIVTNSIGCKDSLEKTIVSFPKPVSKYVTDINIGCSPLTINFTNNSIYKTPATNNWQLESNTTDTSLNPSHTFNGSIYHDTTYSISLITTSIDGCRDTSTSQVFVKSGSTARLSLSDSIFCMSSLNESAIAIANNSIGSVDSFYYDFGDGTSLFTFNTDTVKHIYKAEGNYLLKLSTISDCHTSTDSLHLKVNKNPKPKFALSDTVGCNPFVVNFTNNSIIYGTSYLWDFGNGFTSTKSNPDSITYYQNGYKDTSYIVKLSMSNSCGTGSLVDTLRVLPVPVASFLMSTNFGCSPLTVDYLNTTSGSANSVLWIFGNGDSSTLYNPNMEQFYAGVNETFYKTKLITTNLCGSDTTTNTLKVEPNSVRAFFMNSGNFGCEPFTVTFTDSSVGGNNISWNFGNGITSRLKSPTVTYNTPGVYFAYQYVNNGCSFDTSFVGIEVLSTPKFSFTKSESEICINEKVNFISTIIDSGAITWYFGDGDSSTAYSPNHIYTIPGIKKITAVLNSPSSTCPRIITDSIKVNDIPILKINIDTNFGCSYTYFTFNYNGSNALNYNWDMGDNNLLSQINVSHSYTSAGIYQVKLFGENSFGCKNEISLPVTVYPKPKSKFDFTPKDTCYVPIDVSFINQSSGADAYYWSFGNGQYSNQVNPVTTYTGINNYIIKLISVNQYNCFDTAIDVYRVFNVPHADFDINTTKGCQPFGTSFTNKSSYATEYRWVFGDGENSDIENPTHTYNLYGKFSVKLIAIEGGKCFDSITKTDAVEVFIKPTAGFTFKLDPNYYSATFTNTSTNALSYFWDLGDGRTSNNVTPESKYYATFGEFKTTLIATSEHGCKDTFENTILIPEYMKGLFLPNAFTPDYGADPVRVFKPAGLHLETYHLEIFNKWGELIWETRELDSDGIPTKGWDGNDITGKPCIQGSYIWTISNAKFKDNTSWPGMKSESGIYYISGNVTLLR